MPGNTSYTNRTWVRSHGVWSVTRAGGYLHVVRSALHVLRLSHLSGIPPSQHYKAAPHSNHQYLYKHELNSSHLTTRPGNIKYSEIVFLTPEIFIAGIFLIWKVATHKLY